MVFLVERLHADATFLGDAMHRLPLAHIVQQSLVRLGSALLLFLQPHHFALLQRIVAGQFVVACYLLVADAYFLANGAEGVAAACYDVVVLIIYSNLSAGKLET